MEAEDFILDLHHIITTCSNFHDAIFKYFYSRDSLIDESLFKNLSNFISNANNYTDKEDYELMCEFCKLIKDNHNIDLFNLQSPENLYGDVKLHTVSW